MSRRNLFSRLTRKFRSKKKEDKSALLKSALLKYTKSLLSSYDLTENQYDNLINMIESERFTRQNQVTRYIRDNADIDEDQRKDLNALISRRGFWDTLKSRLRKKRKKITAREIQDLLNYDESRQ